MISTTLELKFEGIKLRKY